MQLNKFTDYSLRVLIYLAVRDAEQIVPTSEIANRFKISNNHLRKVTNELKSLGWIRGLRGVGGGIQLLPKTLEMPLGNVILQLEDFELFECFNEEKNQCVITDACILKDVIAEASRAFIDCLNNYQLRDIVQSTRLRNLLHSQLDV